MGDWSSGQQDQWSNYGGQVWQAHQSQEFHTQSQDFQQFDYGNYGQQQQQQETDPSNPYLAPNAPNPYTGSMFVPDPSPGAQDYKAVHGSPEWEDEPPLLEELGIHPDHILQKTLNVLNPMMTTEAAIAGDSDLAGPIVFALAFGRTVPTPCVSRVADPDLYLEKGRMRAWIWSKHQESKSKLQSFFLYIHWPKLQ